MIRINRRKLKSKLVKATGGCIIQHDGWPCNSCFHALDLELPEGKDIHDYWLAVLAFRGDYSDPKKEWFIPRNDELLVELLKLLEKED